jgi:hypothetical protein
MKEFLTRYSLILGLLLIFLFTWPIDLSNSGVLEFQVPFVIYIFLGWGFIFASLIMTWMYNNTRGSLLLPIANNLTDTNMNVRALISSLEIFAALLVVIYAGAERLSRTEPKQIQASADSSKRMFPVLSD